MTPQTEVEQPVTQPDAPAPTHRWWAPLIAGDLAALWPAIVVAFLGVLGISFGMSFHGLYLFGDVVMGWVIGLCIAGPICVDAFSLLCLLATFLTRDANWRIRAYCWCALLCTVAVSIAGNSLSAYAVLDLVAADRGDSFVWGYRQVSTVVGAAFWPLLSAIALHVLIVVRRHLDERRDKVRQAAALTERATEEEQLLRARAIELAATGATASDITERLGLEASKRRTVERWTEPVRAALAAPRPAIAAKSPTRRVTARADR